MLLYIYAMEFLIMKLSLNRIQMHKTTTDNTISCMNVFPTDTTENKTPLKVIDARCYRH